MKNFRRSLRCLWPYRGRLVLGGICAFLIALLWGGGLAAILPGAKILLSDEGLHGWAWDEITEDRLGASVTLQEVSIIVAKVEPTGPAAAAGITEGDWIVGIVGSASAHPAMPADRLARELAEAEPGTPITLSVRDPKTNLRREATVQPAEASLLGRALGWVAANTPEPANYADRFGLFVWLLAAGLAITVARDVLRFCQEYLVVSAVWRGVMDLRCDNYTTALHLPVTFFATRGTSDTMSRFIADCDELARGQVTLFGKTLVEPAKAVASVALALALSWKLTLLAMIAGPPAFLLIRKLGKKMRRASRRALQSLSDMLAVLEETLTGIRVVKAYTMEGSERRRFFQVNRRLLKQRYKMAAIDAATAPSIEAMGVTAACVAAGAAGYLVFRGGMDANYFLTWMIALFAMFDPVRKLAKVATRFQRAEAAAERVFELRDSEQERSLPGAPMLPRHSRDIEFRAVQFTYPGAAEQTIGGVDLKIRAGQTVAIVGPNGCGKTTLVSLLPRLFDPTGGQVLIDGHDVAEYSLRSLRRQIGLVTQDAVMFHATIGENIAYGLRRPKAEAVLDAARKAFVDEFVRELPDGYDTIVGEHGATLSGGQKQRIAIARAILRDPAILIFDEAMSQIDSDSEQRIHLAMAEFIQDRTTLLVAHRFALVKTAEMIIVMNEGRIVDTGTHEQLLSRCQLYQHLCRTQFVEAR